MNPKKNLCITLSKKWFPHEIQYSGLIEMYPKNVLCSRVKNGIDIEQCSEKHS
jgi:hypothetical protein